MPSGALVIAAENQELFTAEQHASAAGHLGEYLRDVPRSCNGAWRWDARLGRFGLIGHGAECPWHDSTRGETP